MKRKTRVRGLSSAMTGRPVREAAAHRRLRAVGRRMESLERRELLAVTFTPEIGLGLADTNYPKAVLAGDLDGDADLDLVVASIVDD